MSKMFQVYGIGQALIPVLPPPLAFQSAPTVNQTNYEIGQLVFTPPQAPTAFYLYGGAGNWIEIATASGVVLSVTGTANQILATTTNGNVVLSLIGPYTPATYTAHGVLIGEGTGSIVATAPGSAGQFLVSNGSSADPTFQTATPQLVVTPVAGTSQAMTSNHTYIANNASQTTFTLPTTSAVGDVLQVSGSALNTGGWKITYTTGQIIWGPAGSSTITTGSATSAAAAAQSVTMVCVVANTTWVITSNSGTITLA
jgi:hypothetical protein